jgi:ceramide glucosyltransferase
MSGVAAVAAVCVLISLVYYVAASAAAIRFSFRALSPPPPLPKIPPRIAVLKPLHGLSASLGDNLRSYLEQDYPRAEYYFGVSGYEDRAAEVPVGLKAQYNFAQVTLVVGEEPGCANHKIAKVIRMAERASRAEVFVVSDADIAVDREHLRRLVGELYATENTGVVSCIYRALPRGGFASRLEALSVNTDFAPMVMVSSMVEPARYALGATMAIKREALEAIGGFRALKDLLADDYYLGKLASEHGYTVKLSSSIVTSTGEDKHFTDFWARQIRWARTQHTTRPLSLATIVIYGPFWALLYLAASGFSSSGLIALAAVIGGRTAMARLLIGRVLKLPELRGDAWLVVLKDLLMTALWFASLMSNKVSWRGRRLQILRDGTMREVDG